MGGANQVAAWPRGQVTRDGRFEVEFGFHALALVIPYLAAQPPLAALGAAADRACRWEDFGTRGAAAAFASLPFNHPLYILYSSGTTGAPKCIVHGAGGTLLQHQKEHLLHTDLKRSDRLFYFTTCGWMMWNWLMSALATGATLVLYDGSPFHPGPGALWRMAAEERPTVFGTSAKYLAALEKSGFVPAEHVDLAAHERMHDHLLGGLMNGQQPAQPHERLLASFRVGRMQHLVEHVLDEVVLGFQEGYYFVG